jgi:hypothetical protein
MDSLSPAQADAFGLLQTKLYGHLDQAEFLAEKYDDWSPEDIESARRLIPDLVTSIRCFAALHEPPAAGSGGTCGACGVAWPCPALETIHRTVTDPETEFVRIVRATE